MKILMVCLGNICRSPLAEGILQHKANLLLLDWQVDSAGTNGYHNGEAPHVLSQKVARLNAIDISKQRSRKFCKADMQQYDIIYAMANDVLYNIQRLAGSSYDATKVKLILDEQEHTKTLDVPDPWYGTEPGYHKVFAILNEVCDTIITKYGKGK
jgi:protein-tyrosine phosphatase